MGVFLTTTGTASPVIINDMGGRSFVHPTVNFDLTNEFIFPELQKSDDLYTEILHGRIILRDNYGVLIQTRNDLYELEPKNDQPLNLDAGGRLRVSELTTLIDLKQLADKNPIFFDEVIIGGATSVHTPIVASTLMSVTINGDAVIRQTKMRFNYQSGKSLLVFNSFDRFQPQTNVIKRVGYFNSNATSPYNNSKDGVYVESSNGTVYVVVERTGTVVSKIAQADWDDKLDGTGRSGMTIDWSNGQVIAIDLLWLGKAGVRFAIEINNTLVYFHKLSYANIIQDVYMSSPNHSIRYEIRSTGGAGSFNHVCSSVNVEGSRNNLGVILSSNTGINQISANSSGTRYAAIGMRLKDTYLDASIDLLVFSILGTTNNNLRWEFIANPVITGTFTYVSQPNSAIQIALGTGSQTVSGGTIIDGGFIAQKADSRNTIENALRLGTMINGTRDEFILVVTPLANNLQYHASFTRREVI